jgi:exopolysaccharide biosynthesis polyprenyl glycosylphosphotransferase
MERGVVSRKSQDSSPQTPARVDRLVSSRYRDRDYGLRRILLASDSIALLLSLAIALTIVGRRQEPALEALWLVPTIPGWFLLFRAYGLYLRPVRQIEPTHLDDFSSLFHALLVGTLGLWVWFRVLPAPQLNLAEVIAFGFFAFLLTTSFRAGVRIIGLGIWGPEKVLVIAPLADVGILCRKLGNHPEYEMEVVAAMTAEGEGSDGCFDLRICETFEDVGHMLRAREVDHLLVQLNEDLISQEEIAELMRTCHRGRIRFGTFMREKSLLNPSVSVNHVEGTGFLSYHPPVLSRSSMIIKRAMDLAIAIPLLVILAIPMLIIAIAIKLDDGGEVLFRQVRVGKDSKRFRLVKFRTMIPEADSMVSELMEKSLDPDMLVMEEDPRVTRVGGYLRRSSLDELPQLWNVVRGEMSLVGPRPLPVRDDEAVRGWGRHRLDGVPGMTGWWQVLGRNTVPFGEMVEIDYAYLTNWSIWGDVKLLVKTIPLVLTRRGFN